MLTPLRAARQAISSSSRCTRTTWQKPAPISRATVPRYPSQWGERRAFSGSCHRWQSAAAAQDVIQTEAVSPAPTSPSERIKQLPVVCPGCGAPSQTVEAESPGFYGSKRAVKATSRDLARQAEDAIFAQALASGLLAHADNDISPSQQSGEKDDSPSTPICDRCHNLLYQSRGTSILHPSMHSIQQIIEESPHKHNHIYHVLDAADFPLSLIPNLITSLHLPRLRTQNRRSKSIQYIRGRTAEVSFIITRSDLLAPKKEQVDSLVPYLREVLRESLGRSGRNVRLGMVRCVSAHRGWWTRTVKEEIYNRGGAGWVVGKVNVGKSALFEVVFPKGRDGLDVNVKGIREKEEREIEKGFKRLEGPGLGHDDTAVARVKDDADGFTSLPGELGELQEPSPSTASNLSAFQHSELDVSSSESSLYDGPLDDSTLLPPAQPETPFPRMPLVSSLPGTTASPIRIPFGGGKGELIDLPGVHRSSLETHVLPAHRKDLIMQSRVVPEQYTIKAGQSILLGGVIRITPTKTTANEDGVVLAYPFVPLTPHITATDKATGIQTGALPDGTPYDGNVPGIATPAAKANMKSAGRFKLEWDVTKRRAGPLTDPAAGKLKTDKLPFVVYGADVLIEGVGWVELTCQVRRHGQTSRQQGRHGRSNPRAQSGQGRDSEAYRPPDAFDEAARREEEESLVPEVEIWSPEGKFVGIRRPMNAWILGGPKKVAKHLRRGRPRQTISLQRRREGGARGGKEEKRSGRKPWDGGGGSEG